MKFKRLPLRVWISITVIAVLFIGSVIGVRQYYDVNLRPVSANTKTELVNISPGLTVKQIGDLLQNKNLIRSAWAFEWYVTNDLNNRLEAGSFALSPSDSLPQIAQIIASGHVASGTVTILPGKTLAQIKEAMTSSGFSAAAVSAALSPGLYGNFKIMSLTPKGTATLEGLLYPDTFDKTTTTSPETIIGESLNEMGKMVSSKLQSAFAAQGLNVYQAITLASIIQQEVSKPSDMTQVAQIFLTRLKNGMPLGSDVTANYGAIINGQSPSLGYDSPYNTLIHTGLPPTPIGTISMESLDAVAHPAPTNWLYFVTGDNGTTYFESTLQQHNTDTALYCHKLCAQP